MANIPVQAVNTAGATLTFTNATAGGDSFANSGQETVEIVNGGGSAITVTFAAANKCNHGSIHNVVVTIPAGGRYHQKGFDPLRFNDASGLLQITYSAVTTVTLAIFR